MPNTWLHQEELSKCYSEQQCSSDVKLPEGREPASASPATLGAEPGFARSRPSETGSLPGTGW